MVLRAPRFEGCYRRSSSLRSSNKLQSRPRRPRRAADSMLSTWQIEKSVARPRCRWFNDTIGPVDILINAAGINIKDRTMAAMRARRMGSSHGCQRDWSLQHHVRGPPLHAPERQMGTIVNISSIAGKRAIELGGIAYCASKFAMTALGTAAGQEEAERGIRITNVYPGEVDTPLLEQRPKPVSDEHRSRMLKPEDVAELVLTICSLPQRAHVPEIVIKPRLQAYF